MKKLEEDYCKQEQPVENREDKPITEIQEQWDRWVEYFDELLNRLVLLNSQEIEAVQSPFHSCYSTNDRRNQHDHQANQNCGKIRTWKPIS